MRYVANHKTDKNEIFYIGLRQLSTKEIVVNQIYQGIVSKIAENIEVEFTEKGGTVEGRTEFILMKMETYDVLINELSKLIEANPKNKGLLKRIKQILLEEF